MDLIGMNGGEFPGPALNLAWQTGRKVEWPDPISELALDTKIFKDHPELNVRLPTSQTGDMKSLVTPQWHLIVHSRRGAQLYDWRHDPGEATNLIDTPEGRQVAERLTLELTNNLNRSTTSGLEQRPHKNF